MTASREELLGILKIGHNTSIRGEGLSLQEAISRSHYVELRDRFGKQELLAILKTDPNLLQEWVLYSEDKRCVGGYYLDRSRFEIGSVKSPGWKRTYENFEETVAEYVLFELDFWASLEGRLVLSDKNVC